MAILDLHVRHRSISRRELAGEIPTRSYAEDSTVVARAEASSTAVVATNLPTSTKALAGVIAVFGVIILGIIAYKVGKWRREKIRREAMKNRSTINPVYQKDPSYQLSFSPRPSVEEKPTFVHPLAGFNISRPEPVHAPNKAVKKETSRFLARMHIHRKSASTGTKPQPPAYEAVSGIPSAKIPLTVQVPIHTPNTPLTAATLNITSATSPVPSPRSSSYGNLDSSWKSKTPLSGRPRAKSVNGKRYPRLMLVVCTFVPSLPDELRINLGETLRLIEEYEDEWCLVQRVGKSEDERGVIPRFCLQERPDVIGALPLKHHKKTHLGSISESARI
ncbi:hypothetical protein C8Q75DRAFT_736264 [Abortiporus biennis]|nr:hypothetical protein C8Q75DRAFT_736264 [Abortiporus biennis]